MLVDLLLWSMHMRCFHASSQHQLHLGLCIWSVHRTTALRTAGCFCYLHAQCGMSFVFVPSPDDLSISTPSPKCSNYELLLFGPHVRCCVEADW